MCAFVVFSLVFFMPSQEIHLGNVSDMANFELDGTQNLNSINQSCRTYFHQYGSMETDGT